MGTVTATRKSVQRQKTRTARYTSTADGGGALVVRQQTANVTTVDCYFLKPIVCDLGGLGLQLTKHDGEVYHVRLDGTSSHCDCRGHIRWGHCKHVESLLALQAAGRLASLPCPVCQGQGGPRAGDLDSDGAFCRACGK